MVAVLNKGTQPCIYQIISGSSLNTSGSYAAIKAEFVKAAHLTPNQSEEGPKLTKSQTRRRTQKARTTASSQNNVLGSSTPTASVYAAPTLAEGVSGRGGKREQRDFSASDPLERARPTSKRQLVDVPSSSEFAFPNLIMVVHSQAVYLTYSGSERAALDDHINRMFENYDRSIRGGCRFREVLTV